MEHVASVPTAASGRMSPEALGLAVLLHALAAMGLWWLATYRPIIAPPEDPVEILFEKPKPPDPPPPPPKPPQPTPQPAPPIQGLRPPAEITADKPTQVRPSADAPKDIAGPQPRSLEDELPKQPPEPPPPAPSEAALAPTPSPPTPTPPPGPRPPLFSAPPLATVTPAPQIHPAPPPTVTPQPQQSHPTPPPPALTPHPQPRPSPLIARPQDHSPAIARREEPQSSSPFVNPADTFNRATASTNYLWQVVRKLRGYRYQTHAPVGEGLTVVQIVIARDGRLLDVRITQSSGVAEMDQGVLTGVRQGSPYTPLPPEIAGDRASFTLPLVSVPIR